MRSIPAWPWLPMAIAITLSPAPALAQAVASPSGFTLKDERPDTGSNILRDRVSGSALPYDKRYAELTPEQQRILKSAYVEMGEGDEPPFPLEGLGPLYTAIAKANQLAGAAVGKLEMDVFIDEAGQPTKVELVKSPDTRLATHVATIAMLTRFKPALCKGQPCAMGFPISILFTRR